MRNAVGTSFFCGRLILTTIIIGESCMQPTDFWQDTEPAGTYEKTADTRYRDFYPADLPDGRQLALPIRPRAEGPEAIASFIANQASFAVLDTLAQALADLLSTDRPDIIVGMPTLGLALAAETARKLGHKRYVPLGTSRKFWYDDGLSVALKSITSPDQAKNSLHRSTPAALAGKAARRAYRRCDQHWHIHACRVHSVGEMRRRAGASGCGHVADGTLDRPIGGGKTGPERQRARSFPFAAS